MTPGAELEIHAWGGGQVDSDGHGDVTVGVRKGSWRADLFTDTLELAWEPDTAQGNAWIRARGQAFAAQMMLSPWTDGAPDPSRAVWAAAGSLRGGGQRYLPHGLFVGAEAEAALLTFWAKDDRTTTVPDARTIVSGTASIGVWRDRAEVRLDGGTLIEDGQLVPFARGYARWEPGGVLVPEAELRAGAMEGASEVTSTRLGGLVPYAVPLAGAAWGEWWVEDYVAARVGVTAGSMAVRGGALVDAAAWAGPEQSGTGVGFAVTGEARWRRAYAELAGGYAPWIPRGEGISRVSVFFRVGLDWSPVRPKGVREG